MLTSKQAKEIRKKLIDEDMTVNEFAKHIKINRTTVSSILCGLISSAKHEETMLNWLKNKKEQ